MTTSQDWLFRSEYLEMQARHKREQAATLIREAEHFEHLASSAHHIAINDAIDNLGSAINP